MRQPRRVRRKMAPGRSVGSVKKFVSTVSWAVGMYARAHMLLRGFLIKETAAFSGASLIVMQCTLYFVALLLTIWFYWSRAEQCCLDLREMLGCPGGLSMAWGCLTSYSSRVRLA